MGVVVVVDVFGDDAALVFWCRREVQSMVVVKCGAPSGIKF